MKDSINYGIDLGTTNSAIAVYQDGIVKIIKNPVGLQDTLPSIVAYKKNRILIGDKAKEIFQTDPKNVFSSFKRKMGTSDSYHSTLLNEQLTPIDLSALILKELKSFEINTAVDSVVITIPASFDTLQSNATKEAGFKAGFKEVVLLQEPIAACLCYANDNNLDIDTEQKWLVYDFGGGTFDAAIVKINQRDLKIIDHKGDNFLGGLDIDTKLLSNLVLPKIEENTTESDLWQKISDPDDKIYHRFGKYLLYKCEQLKKELSIRTSAFIEIDFDDLDLYIEFEVKRFEFNEVVAPAYKSSKVLVDELLQENQLQYADFERIILVGGTTYIPLIREKLAEDTEIQVDNSIDPTTAVVRGAAFYAGNKQSQLEKEETGLGAATSENNELITTFESQSNDEEELISFIYSEGYNGFYRIIRKDGGYDSGLIPFESKGKEFVTLASQGVSNFTLSIFDKKNNLVAVNDNISITKGLYTISGQPIPNDICIEIDADKETYLELIFKKNEILPLKKTVYKRFSKSIAKGSSDKIIINIVEGKVGTMPGANKTIGYLEILGEELNDDIIKGSDLELDFAISESRDLKLDVYISSIDQTISKSFVPNFQTDISSEKLISEIEAGLRTVNREIEKELQEENYLVVQNLQELNVELGNLKEALKADNFFGDSKHQLIDKKRKLLYQIDQINFLKNIETTIDEYKRVKEYLQSNYDELIPVLQTEYEKIVKQEVKFLASGDKYLIENKKNRLDEIADRLYFEKDESYLSIFINLKFKDPSFYKEYDKVESLFQEGDRCMEKSDYKALKAVCRLIFGYIKDTDDRNKSQNIGKTELK